MSLHRITKNIHGFQYPLYQSEISDLSTRMVVNAGHSEIKSTCRNQDNSHVDNTKKICLGHLRSNHRNCISSKMVRFERTGSVFIHESVWKIHVLTNWINCFQLNSNIYSICNSVNLRLFPYSFWAHFPHWKGGSNEG